MCAHRSGTSVSFRQQIESLPCRKVVKESENYRAKNQDLCRDVQELRSKAESISSLISEIEQLRSENSTLTKGMKHLKSKATEFDKIKEENIKLKLEVEHRIKTLEEENKKLVLYLNQFYLQGKQQPVSDQSEKDTAPSPEILQYVQKIQELEKKLAA